MKIVDNIFYVDSMTTLRYAIPFIKTTKKLLDKDVLLVYNTVCNRKYNSNIRHESLLQKICKKHDVKLFKQERDDDLKTCNLFCLENTSKGISYENYYSFQHGFDYTGLYKNVPNATYLVTEQYFKNELTKLNMNSLLQPFPVVFWDWDYYVNEFILSKDFLEKKQNIATMFYPESGSQDMFKRIREALDSRGYTTHIKQRRKNQVVPTEFDNIFYDDLWYPTESIFLPIISDVIVGFGTSAYTDLIHINRSFVDLCIPDYSKKYYKPRVNNLISITNNFYDEFCKLSFKNVTMSDKLANPCDFQKIKDFLLQVII